MSIVAAIKVYDGVVLGADSATSITGTVAPGQVQIVKSYQNAQKLFRIDTLNIGVLTYGLGNIGNRSIASIITEFNKSVIPTRFTASHSVADITTALLEFVKQKYDEAFVGVPPNLMSQFTLGFYVGGFSQSDIVAQEWEFILPTDTVIKSVKDQFAFGVSWRGQSIPFYRLYKGYDPRLLEELVSKYNLNQQEVLNIVGKYESSIQYNGMPLQDAVDFLCHVLLTTINTSKFEIGIPTCSEPIDVAVITNKEYKTIRTKDLNF